MTQIVSSSALKWFVDQSQLASVVPSDKLSSKDNRGRMLHDGLTRPISFGVIVR